MPLSHKRDRERKRLLRLENKKVQPKVVVPELDADGNPIPEYD